MWHDVREVLFATIMFPVPYSAMIMTTNWRSFWLLLLWLVFVAGPTYASASEPSSPAQARIDRISSALAAGEVGMVQILQIPARIETRTRVTPEMLERQFHNKVTIRDVAETAYRNTFVKAFQSTHVEGQGNGADLRWGAIFYSRTGARVGAVYFDKFGHNGTVDNYPVVFNGAFFNWLHDTFAKCLQ